MLPPYCASASSVLVDIAAVDVVETLLVVRSRLVAAALVGSLPDPVTLFTAGLWKIFWISAVEVEISISFSSSGLWATDVFQRKTLLSSGGVGGYGEVTRGESRCDPLCGICVVDGRSTSISSSPGRGEVGPDKASTGLPWLGKGPDIPNAANDPRFKCCFGLPGNLHAVGFKDVNDDLLWEIFVLNGEDAYSTSMVELLCNLNEDAGDDAFERNGTSAALKPFQLPAPYAEPGDMLPFKIFGLLEANFLIPQARPQQREDLQQCYRIYIYIGSFLSTAAPKKSTGQSIMSLRESVVVFRPNQPFRIMHTDSSLSRCAKAACLSETECKAPPNRRQSLRSRQ